MNNLTKKIHYFSKQALAIFLGGVEKFLLLHSAAVFASLPIIGLHNISISTAALFGSFIFTPIMIVFILLCSILFFSELLFGTSPEFLLFSVEFMCQMWIKILKILSNSWLLQINFGSAIICNIIIAATFILCVKIKLNVRKSIFFLHAISHACIFVLGSNFENKSKFLKSKKNFSKKRERKAPPSKLQTSLQPDRKQMDFS